MDPKVSIVVVAHNEEKNIHSCLMSLRDQIFDSYEVLIVDGNSTDATKDICEEFVRSSEKFHYLLNPDPQQTISANRNVGLHAARGRFVGFIDADCIAPANWLATLVDALQQMIDDESKMVAGVGGANIAPPDGTPIMKAIAAVQSSRLGFIHSIQGQQFAGQFPVKSLSCSNALFRKDVVLSVGGFNEQLKNMGEDYELSFKIRTKGFRLYTVPGNFVWHKLRASFGAFAKNMTSYGRGRIILMKTIQEYPVIYFIPMLFLITFFTACLFGVFFWPFFWVPFSYLLIITVYSSFLARQHHLAVTTIAAIFFILHFSYPFGQLQALLLKK
jgi:GT2 family glycosyltransferase